MSEVFGQKPGDEGQATVFLATSAGKTRLSIVDGGACPSMFLEVLKDQLQTRPVQGLELGFYETENETREIRGRFLLSKLPAVNRKVGTIECNIELRNMKQYNNKDGE